MTALPGIGATRIAAAVLAGAVCLAAMPAAAALNGEAQFRQHCAACHQPDGSGVPGLAPPLANSLARHLASPRAGEYLARVVVGGLAGQITVAGQTMVGAMPGMPQLSDEEIGAVLNYVVRGLNGAAEDRVSPADVASVRQSRPDPNDTLRLRRSLLGG